MLISHAREGRQDAFMSHEIECLLVMQIYGLDNVILIYRSVLTKFNLIRDHLKCVMHLCRPAGGDFQIWCSYSTQPYWS